MILKPFKHLIRLLTELKKKKNEEEEEEDAELLQLRAQVEMKRGKMREYKKKNKNF
jgi:ATP/maltotriose-dependent transcriptional regulator MalT